MVELGFRAGKMRFRFASYPPRPFLCTRHIEFFESEYYSSEENDILLRFLNLWNRNKCKIY